MKTVKYYTLLWKAYMRIGFLTAMQYPADTLIWVFSMLIREASGFIGIITIARAAGGLAEWNLYEICILFAMCAIVESIGQAFFDCIWNIEPAVHKGILDVYLVRPASPFIQLLGQYIHFQAILSMFVYIGVFVWAAYNLNLQIQGREICILIEYIVCGTIINSGIYTIFNCLNFWIVRGEDIAILVQTCREFVKYPLTVFPKLIQGFFTYLLPLGFVAYYPALYLLNKTDLPIGILLPMVALGIGIIATLLWKAGVKGYDSTGT